MSDDTPTLGFPDPDGDTPTQRFDAAIVGGDAGAGTAPVATTDGEELVEEKKRSRGLLIGLIAAGAALLIAIIILLVILFTQGADGTPNAGSTSTPSATPSVTPSVTPTVSETPTPTPTPTQTPTAAPPPPPPPPPPPADPILSYTASMTTVDCSGGVSAVDVTFSWAATGSKLWFGVGTDNAKAEPFDELPLNYTFDFPYQCGQPGGQQKYTITVEAENGNLTHDTIIIKE